MAYGISKGGGLKAQAFGHKSNMLGRTGRAPRKREMDLDSKVKISNNTPKGGGGMMQTRAGYKHDMPSDNTGSGFDVAGFGRSKVPNG